MSNEAKRHNVYLAIPGKQFCWGTTIGVINSTRKHAAHPYNGGMGFSGVIDFNLCLTDALNLYEEGKVTHFAMLHGDISPDSNQHWLDILLDIMDEKGAAVVSAVSPIKDFRGVTSTGIGDPNDPWGAFRRFTMKEVLTQLPETFDAADSGYPDKVLLHNTGCWVADLSHPFFHETNQDGSLRHFFEFPERIVRNKEGKWEHQQESEDWHFSRQLWEAGVYNTWITRKVRFMHKGGIEFPNYEDFGQFKNGDENTAAKWRTELEAKPLALTQMLQFELGTECNLADQHDRCPNRSPLRYAGLDTSHELDDHTIIGLAVQAYRDLGFTGFVGWIYYNEPLLQADRMFSLMERIKAEAPQARFILWTNGTLMPEECERFAQFEQIIVSGYNEQSYRGRERLLAKKINLRYMDKPELDGRLHQITPADASAPCFRPFVEFIIDNYGNTHLCCYDWQGKSTFGNVFHEPFPIIAQRWRDMLPSIAGHKMSGEAPACCVACGHRWDKYQCHDERIVDSARRFRASLEPKAEVAT